MAEDNKSERHKRAMQKQKASVEQSLALATEERGLLIFLTGDGKGKTTSAFGMVLRALGYGQRVGVVQFIKGQQLSGEEIFLRDKLPAVEFVQMGTGFTWDTQDRSADIAAAESTWAQAKQLLQRDDLDLLVLDELTYMFAYRYLDEAEVLDSIVQRPEKMSVIVTGRGGGSGLRELADTVSEVKDIKHAYRSGLRARKGVDY